MTPEEAEKWIANLIRNDKQLKQLDAKIDSKEVEIKIELLSKRHATFTRI